MNNILIVGLGNMGLAHLKSFLVKKKFYNLFLLDSDRRIIKKLQNSFSTDKKILIYKNYPKGFKFHLAIISTKSKDRLKAITKIIKYNEINYLLLEKFLFNKISDYKKFEKLNKYKANKTFVNIWSKQFLKLIKLKKSQKVFFIKVELPEYKLLTNLIHFYEIFRILTNDKIRVNLDFFKLKKIKKNYYDGTGKIILNNVTGSKMEILSKKKGNNFSFNYRSVYLKKNIKVSGGKIFLREKNRKKILDFPLASRVTEKIYQKIISKKNTILPNYSQTKISSQKIINSLNKRYQKKISIY